MAEEDEIAALVIDNGSGMCKGGWLAVKLLLWLVWRKRNVVLGRERERRDVRSWERVDQRPTAVGMTAPN